jgi:ammonium transporter, Amt family
MKLRIPTAPPVAAGPERLAAPTEPAGTTATERPVPARPVVTHTPRRRRWVGRTVPVVAAALVAGLAGAQAADATTKITVAVDTAWVLLTAALVFFMQAGFALVEAGFQSAKNVVNILMKNASDFMVASIAFWAFGFAFMFGNGTGLLGLHGWFLAGPDNSPLTGSAYHGIFASLNWTDVPLFAKFFFQLVFAGTAATIVSGAIGGRVKFPAYLIFSVVMTTFIYSVTGHWAWGGGWLSQLGFIDFAGSTVVHAVGGFAALGAAVVLGPRIGRYQNGKVNAFPGHNMTFAALGVFILWLGWFGFNPGSTMGIVGQPGLVARIFLTTNIAAAAGGIASMAVSWLRFGKPDFSMTMNGLLAGLVAITAPCAFVSPAAGVVIGLVAGAIVVLAIPMFDAMGIDDPVGAVSVHGIAGMWGTISVGLFGLPALGAAGLFAGGGIHSLLIQTLGTVSMSAFAFGTVVVLWLVLKATIGIRVAPHEEIGGLDVAEHGTEAYVPADALGEPVILGAGD